MKNKLDEHISEVKQNLSVLPVNTKANRKKKEEFIMEEESINSENTMLVLDEIKKRLSYFNGLNPNSEIEDYGDKLKAYNILNDLSEYTTSYEKMHIDKYLRELEVSSKEDLKSVNDSLRSIINAFNDAKIAVKKEDFDFNNYASEYMGLIISGASEDDLRSKFEEIYWKFPELLKTISINIKSIYIKNEKKIDKHFGEVIEKYNKSFENNDVHGDIIALNSAMKYKMHTDPYIIFDKFKTGKYNVNTFNKSAIEAKINKYFTPESYNYDNLVSVSKILFEYYMIVKYNYILNDMKERLEKKEEYKGVKAKTLSEINKEAKKLISLNKASNKTGIFRKKTEKLLFEYNEVLKDLIKKYDEYDNVCFNDLIYQKLYSDSNISDILKFASSHYLYFTNELIENGIANINDINKEFDELREDINNKEFFMINSIALLDRKKMKEIISDKYKLEGIMINEEYLEEENITKTIEDINDILRYEDIKVSGVSIEDIELYLEIGKITGGK